LKSTKQTVNKIDPKQPETTHQLRTRSDYAHGRPYV